MTSANFAKLVAVPLSCVILLGSSVATQGQAPPKSASKAKAAPLLFWT